MIGVITLTMRLAQKTKRQDSVPARLKAIHAEYAEELMRLSLIASGLVLRLGLAALLACNGPAWRAARHGLAKTIRR